MSLCTGPSSGQREIFRLPFRSLRPGRATQHPAIFVTSLIREFFVKRHRAFKQRRSRDASQARDRQTALGKFDDPAAQLRIFLVLRRRDGRRERAVDRRALNYVRHLVAAVQHAQVLEARPRVSEHFQVGFDLLRSSAAGNFHRLAKFPIRHVECRAGYFKTGQNFGCAKIRVFRRRRNLNWRNRHGLEVHPQPGQIVSRCVAMSVAGEQMICARLAREENEINRAPLDAHGGNRQWRAVAIFYENK